MVQDPSDRPDYKVYRSRGSWSRRLRRSLSGKRSAGPRIPRPSRPPKDPSSRSRDPRGPRSLKSRLRSGRPKGAGRSRATWWLWTRRALIAIAVWIVFWLVLSGVLFVISAQMSESRLPDSAKQALAGGDHILFGSSTMLILGSDKRPANSKEPGAKEAGARSDTMMLWRFTDGRNAKLSIPRDTQTEVPGLGQTKINAAYSVGGAAESIQVVDATLPPVQVNHVIDVNFEGFGDLVDALGGVTMKTQCIKSTFGGKTINIKAGTHHFDGEQALQVVRARHNSCEPNETDLSRDRRQQQFISAVTSKLTSPMTFFRLPWVAWNGPRSFDSDLGTIGLMSTFLSTVFTSSQPPTLLPVTPIPGTSNLQMTQPQASQTVDRFMQGEATQSAAGDLDE